MTPAMTTGSLVFFEDSGTLAILLSQLKVVHGDQETAEAAEDWHYWVEMGSGSDARGPASSTSWGPGSTCPT